ncbi:MAG TPA: hypothetical protein PKD79_01685 [Candidatus Doudnabacteria bacterium]|nr:hypothetical protein [Candidatus Doudnabacteria bacterium]
MELLSKAMDWTIFGTFFLFFAGLMLLQNPIDAVKFLLYRPKEFAGTAGFFASLVCSKGSPFC